MKNSALVQRWRAGSAAVKGSALRRPLRLWMTGSVAVVMAAFVPVRGMTEVDAVESDRLLRHSPFGVHETLQRIEAAAYGSGLSVLARMGGPRPVIVLASSAGGTLVVMDEASSRIELPLSLRLWQRSDGSVDVAFGGAAFPGSASAGDEGRFGAGLQDLPMAVADDLAALPALLERALG